MDFILENEGKPVPDLSAVSSSGTSSTAAPSDDAPVDEDDREEIEALRAVYGKAADAGGSADAEQEAKVGCTVPDELTRANH